MDVKSYENVEPEVISIKRNPYLVDYAQQKAERERRRERYRERQGRTAVKRESAKRDNISRGRMIVMADHTRQPERVRRAQNDLQHPSEDIRNLDGSNLPRRRRTAVERRRAAERRRRIVMMQRLGLCGGVFCIALLCGLLFIKRGDAKAAESGITPQRQETASGVPQVALPGVVQGISAEDYAMHPVWEEKFLTPNEYSRPQDALEEVNSIFVHYTANPETSAAQNRSYFEQLKDTHDRSASAHFIIGYDGEIIQCIPLDEIAYAVQTRNFDSISIECCYKSKDGSFTQETYDSLIDLLAWLTDVYDLSTDDILRHYDCGGKKCPIYYTEHEDAWKKLKSDVAAQQNI